MAETGGLMCLGCGYEHNCPTKGCAILREAADAIEQDMALARAQLETRYALNAALRDMKHDDNCDVCIGNVPGCRPECGEDMDCETCKNKKCRCRKCVRESNFKWRGPCKENGE